MLIAKNKEIEDKLVQELVNSSDLVAPDGYLYKHKHLNFVQPNKYIRFRTYYYLLGKPLTQERIFATFGVDQKPPYIETEADYKLIEDQQIKMK